MNVNGLSEGETFWGFDYYHWYEWDNGFDCQYSSELLTLAEPAIVLPTITVGAVTLSPNTISTAQNATLSITLTASSNLTVSSGTGVTLEVGISNASQNFQLGFNPNVYTVTLSPGQSRTFTFAVSVASAPASTATCNLTAIVNIPTPPTIAVVNNNAASGQVIVNP